MVRVLYLPILFYPFNGLTGGAIVSYEIITRLSKQHQVLTVLTNARNYKLSLKKDLKIKNFYGLPDPLSPVFPLSQMVGGMIEAKKFNPEIIIAQYHPSDLISFVGKMLSRFAKVPLIVRSDDIWFIPFKKFSFISKLIHNINVEVIKNSTYFLVNSSEHRLMVEKMYERSRGIVIHPNGVDTKRFNPYINNTELKRKLGLEDKSVVLYSGSAAWFYGLELLPKAFSFIAKEEKDAWLVLIGLFGNKKVLIHELERNNVKSKTIILPPIRYETINRYIALGDVCIGTLCSFPVNIGTIPTKVLQYMACGKPTIVAKGGVSKDLIINGETGLTFFGDYRELANKIITLLQDSNLSKKIGRNAKDHVVFNYDWDILVSKLNSLIRGACQ